jgi:threonine dehydrogenase-like Zn-dependent dehydrogenase
MKALRFDGSRPRVVSTDAPRPDRDYALLRPRLAGVCNTDLEIARGYMGFEGTLGHEVVGDVIEGPSEWLGRRVVSEINFACGRCPACERELGRHCPHRRVMGILGADGAFAEAVVVPVANLHAVPDTVGDELAVFAEPLAAAFEILEQVGAVEDRSAVVLGDGKLGSLVAQVLSSAGARVLAVGHHGENLALLGQRGIETCEARSFDPSTRQRADLVVEATGSPSALATAIAATRPRGTLILKTTSAERTSVDLAPIVIDEIQLLGSRCGPFAPALRALSERSVDVTPWIEARYPLDRGVEALEHAARRGARKVLIEFATRDHE